MAGCAGPTRPGPQPIGISFGGGFNLQLGAAREPGFVSGGGLSAPDQYLDRRHWQRAMAG